VQARFEHDDEKRQQLQIALDEIMTIKQMQ
jgi:hypothetical protein